MRLWQPTFYAICSKRFGDRLGFWEPALPLQSIGTAARSKTHCQMFILRAATPTCGVTRTDRCPSRQIERIECQYSRRCGGLLCLECRQVAGHTSPVARLAKSAGDNDIIYIFSNSDANFYRGLRLLTSATRGFIWPTSVRVSC